MRKLLALFGASHPLWRAPHRPLFFCAGLWALIAPTVWLWPEGMIVDPVAWHLRALLFGMGGAAVGGYLLTALPSWTGSPPTSPQAVRALTLLWAAAQLAGLAIPGLPGALHLLPSLAFFGLLAVILARGLIAARVFSKLWSVVAVLGLALGDAVLLCSGVGEPWATRAPLAMVFLFAALIGVIGGRAVPAFTASWMQHTCSRLRPREWPVLSPLALIATLLGAGLTLANHTLAAGLCLLIAGVVQLARLLGWYSWQSRHYPALLVLHLAWVWLPVGLILLGLATLRPDVLAQGTALHALTMGAMGSMIIAIAGRAAMARRGNLLIVGGGLGAAFGLVWSAALLRVASPRVTGPGFDGITASALLWMLGWALFLWAYRPALSGDIPWPILSARRAASQQVGQVTTPSQNPANPESR